jgi:lysophospholipase L1-like esterase
MNDFDFEDSSGEKIRYFRKPRSFLIRRLERMPREQFGIDFYRYHYSRTGDRVFAEVEKMRDLANRNDVPFAVAILPVFGDPPAGWRFDNYTLADIHAEVIDNLRARDIEVIDTLPGFQALGRPPGAVALDPWHPNPEGHRVIAEALVGPALERLR